MEDFLAAVPTYICDEAPAIRSDSFLRSQLPGYLGDTPQDLGLCVSHFSQIIEVLIGDDQNMNRRLRRYILEGCNQFILMELL